jgi:hypothetical protein
MSALPLKKKRECHSSDLSSLIAVKTQGLSVICWIHLIAFVHSGKVKIDVVK